MNRKDWDRLARVYDAEVFDIFTHDTRQVVRVWLRRHGLLTGRPTIVDAGCGTGSFFRRFGRHFGVKHGVDHSPAMLRLAARRCRTLRGCSWQLGDVQQMPPELRGIADLVVCANVITFRSILTCRRAVKDVVRCLKPGGWLLLVVPSLESHDRGVTYRIGRPPPRRSGTSAIIRRDDRFQRFFTKEGARQLARSAGVRDIVLHSVSYPWIDEGITRPPAGVAFPNVWMVTARRRARRSI